MLATIKLPDWAKDFVPHASFKTAYGGRASGKTFGVSHLLILEAVKRTVTVACCRLTQTSIRDSIKPSLEEAIERLHLSNHFEIRQTEIVCNSTGSRFFFHGLDRMEKSIYGWQSVGIVWVDEAQFLPESTAKILVPTMRMEGAELWFTWNPQTRTDWVWDRFVMKARPGDVIKKVNYYDNIALPERSLEEANWAKEHNPNEYKHVWLGEPDDEGAGRQVLPYSLVVKCVDAYKKFRPSGMRPRDAGMDIADGGADYNSAVVREGPVVALVDRFPTLEAGDHDPVARRVIQFVGDVGRLYYDATGVGSTMGKTLRRNDFHGARRRIRAGDKVAGEGSIFARELTNKQMFMNRGTQCAWSLKIRAENTSALLKGEDVKPERCLFIDPSCCDGGSMRFEEYLNQLSQPVYEDMESARVKLKKIPDGEPSPDAFDATSFSFANDSQYGLVDRRAVARKAA